MRYEIIFLNCGEIDQLLSSVKQEYLDYPIQIRTHSTDNPVQYINELSDSGRNSVIITSGIIKNRLAVFFDPLAISILTCNLSLNSNFFVIILFLNAECDELLVDLSYLFSLCLCCICN